MTVKPLIKGVHVVPMGMANAFLIEGDDGLTLFDAGFPGKEAAVFEAIHRLDRSPDHLKHLIFTHGHPDHIGSAAAIVRELQNPGIAHERAAFRRLNASRRQSWGCRCYVPKRIMCPELGHLPFLLGGARAVGHIIFKGT